MSDYVWCAGKDAQNLRGDRLNAACTLKANIANIGSYPICNAFVDPATSAYKCFVDTSLTFKFFYNFPTSTGVSPGCRADLTFPDPNLATTTWELVTAPDVNNNAGGFVTPVPSIKQNVKYLSPDDFTVYVTCAPAAAPLKFSILWGRTRSVAVVTIATVDNLALCTAMATATQAPSRLPTAYPSYEPCWDASIEDMLSNPIGSVPICNMWREPDNTAVCYTDSAWGQSSGDLPFRIDYALADASDRSVTHSPDCVSRVTFPPKTTAWVYVNAPDSEDGIGGFATPLQSIRLLTDYQLLDLTVRQMYVYVNCGAAQALQFSEQWCSIYCSIITITPDVAPKLCAFLATGVMSVTPTRVPTYAPFRATAAPTAKSTVAPTALRTFRPATKAPTKVITKAPTKGPTKAPTKIATMILEG